MALVTKAVRYRGFLDDPTPRAPSAQDRSGEGEPRVTPARARPPTGHRHTCSAATTIPGRRAPSRLRNPLLCGCARSPSVARSPESLQATPDRSGHSVRASCSTSQSRASSSSSNKNARTSCSERTSRGGATGLCDEQNMCSYSSPAVGRRGGERVFVRVLSPPPRAKMAYSCGILGLGLATKIASRRVARWWQGWLSGRQLAIDWGSGGCWFGADPRAPA